MACRARMMAGAGAGAILATALLMLMPPIICAAFVAPAGFVPSSLSQRTSHGTTGCVVMRPSAGYRQLSQSVSVEADNDDGKEVRGTAKRTPAFTDVDAERRRFLSSMAAPTAALSFLLSNGRAASALDCDPKDVLCRQKTYDSYVDKFQENKDLPSSAQPIPAVTNRITYVVQLIIDIGERRDGDAGYLRFGLYGDDCPGSAKQMLLFLTRGITALDRAALDDRLEVEAIPVSLGDGNGSVQGVCPGKGIDFGVPSQSKAFAKFKGTRSAGPNFVPQGRPVPTLEGESFPRPHDVAGLVSVPARGIGYGMSDNSAELDEIYSRAFTITAGPMQQLDEQTLVKRRRVIGQVIDDESMRFLDRLANLPVQKKLGKGGESEPPLLKVRVRDVDVQKVKG